MGEESGATGDSEITWVVDPIDGTTNVVHGLEYSAVSIGLLRDGLPVAGVIYSIFTRSVFSAVFGQGAWVNDLRVSGGAVRCTSPHPINGP